MSRDAEAGYEILLGNKQLLSIFIIVVILLVVFFTMGYVLGKNTAGIVATERVPAAAAPPSGFGTAQQPRETSASSAPAAFRSEAETAGVGATKPRIRAGHPLLLLPQAPRRSLCGPGLSTGSGRQTPDAELVSSVLRKKGFRTLVAPGPSDAVFRVLVGPLVGGDAIAKARADLETLRFKPILRKY